MPRRILTAREQVAMTAPWRRHAADVGFRWERDAGGDWILVTRNPDGNPVALPTERAPSVRTSRRTAAGGDYDNWEEYDKPEDWVDDYPLEDEVQEDYLRRVYEPHPPSNPDLPDHLKPHLHLPIDVVHHYREFDRPYDANTRMLERIIGDQGIRQPLRISTDGTHALLHEGNHRLHAARRLGLTHLPVQVTLEKPGDVMRNNGARPPAPLEPVLADWVDRNRHTLRSFWD
jgi:hypothetical protein